MNVESIQASFEFSKTRSIRKSQPEEKFSKILSQSMNLKENHQGKVKDSKIQLEDLTIEETVPEKVHISNINPMATLFYIGNYENKVIESFSEETVLDCEIQLIPISINGNISDAMTTDMMNDDDILIDVNKPSIYPTGVKDDLKSILNLPQLRDEQKNEFRLDIKDEVGSLQKEINKDIGLIAEAYPKELKIVSDKLIVEDFVISDKDSNALKTIVDDTNDTKEKSVEIKDTTGINAKFDSRFDTKISPQNSVVSKENIQRINESIVQLIETTSEGDANIMTVKLYPKELGTVDVTLRMEEGKLTAKILVDSDHVKQLFTSKISELNESLLKQNIFIEKVDIDINQNLNPTLSTNANSSGESNQNRENYPKNNSGVELESEAIDPVSNNGEDPNLGTSVVNRWA